MREEGLVIFATIFIFGWGKKSGNSSQFGPNLIRFLFNKGVKCKLTKISLISLFGATGRVSYKVFILSHCWELIEQLFNPNSHPREMIVF